MKLAVEEREERVIVRVQEPRVDAQRSGDLKTQLLALTAQGKSEIVVDLCQVTFIDSSGLGALIAAYRKAADASGTLRLACLQPQVRSVFELTRLQKVFEVYPSVEDALHPSKGPSGEHPGRADG